MLAKTDKLK